MIQVLFLFTYLVFVQHASLLLFNSRERLLQLVVKKPEYNIDHAVKSHHQMSESMFFLEYIATCSIPIVGAPPRKLCSKLIRLWKELILSINAKIAYVITVNLDKRRITVSLL